MEKQTMKNETVSRRSGGLYSKINMSLKSANIMVLSLIALLVAASAFIINHNGFTVSFESGGGSYTEPLRAMYSDKVSVSAPVREGYKFTGWYTDRACTQKWDMKNGEISGSMTLYAGWEKTE